MPAKLTLFILYHAEAMLRAVPPLSHFVKINLATLPIKYCSNLLGEGRAFLANLDTGGADYVGFINARWDQKYPDLSTRLRTLPTTVMRAIDSGVLYRQSVLAPWTTDCQWSNISANWYDFTIRTHRTMQPLLAEWQALTGLSFNTGRRSFWANDFICHRLTYLDFRDYWRACFHHFQRKYGYILPFSTWGLDVSRQPAYFYERCSVAYWANRLDLTVTALA